MKYSIYTYLYQLEETFSKARNIYYLTASLVIKQYLHTNTLNFYLADIVMLALHENATKEKNKSVYNSTENPVNDS